MTNRDSRKQFDLAERTSKFGETAVLFARQVPVDHISEPLLNQFVRAAGSVGANYCEADESVTKKEFRYRIGLCKRESRETNHWLRLIVAACPTYREPAREIWQEADELTRIFAAIHRKSGPPNDE